MVVDVVYGLCLQEFVGQNLKSGAVAAMAAVLAAVNSLAKAAARAVMLEEQLEW